LTSMHTVVVNACHTASAPYTGEFGSKSPIEVAAELSPVSVTGVPSSSSTATASLQLSVASLVWAMAIENVAASAKVHMDLFILLKVICEFGFFSGKNTLTSRIL